MLFWIIFYVNCDIKVYVLKWFELQGEINAIQDWNFENKVVHVHLQTHVQTVKDMTVRVKKYAERFLFLSSFVHTQENKNVRN